MIVTRLRRKLMVIGIVLALNAAACGDDDSNQADDEPTPTSTSVEEPTPTSTPAVREDDQPIEAIRGDGWVLLIGTPGSDPCAQIVSPDGDLDPSFCGATGAEAVGQGVSVAFMANPSGSGTIVYGLVRDDAAEIRLELVDADPVTITVVDVDALDGLSTFATGLTGAVAAERLVVLAADGTTLADLTLQPAD